MTTISRLDLCCEDDGSVVIVGVTRGGQDVCILQVDADEALEMFGAFVHSIASRRKELVRERHQPRLFGAELPSRIEEPGRFARLELDEGRRLKTAEMLADDRWRDL